MGQGASGADPASLYEDVVEGFEGNVELILDFCGLAFEPAYASLRQPTSSDAKRNVLSLRQAPSRVRQSILRHELFQWKSYESCLGPLKDGLGDALTGYRE